MNIIPRQNYIKYRNKNNKKIKYFILSLVNFARNPRFTHDSAVPIPPLPTLSLCDEFNEIPSNLVGFAKNQLVRGQNRFISAIDQAIQLVI